MLCGMKGPERYECTGGDFREQKGDPDGAQLYALLLDGIPRQRSARLAREGGCRARQGHGGGQRDRPAHPSAARQPWIHRSWEGRGGSATPPPSGPSSSASSEGRGSCHGWEESAHPSLRAAGTRTSHRPQARDHTSACPLIPAVTSRE